MELPPNLPPLPVPDYYHTSGIPRQPTQPASISVISIFAIALGALVVLCDGMGLLSAAIQLAFSSAHFTAMQNQMQTTSMKVFTILQSLIGLALGGVLLAGGIGGVQVRAWARKLLIQWAVVDLIFQAITCAIGIYYTLTVSMPAIQQQVNRPGRGAPNINGFVHIFSIGGVAAGILLTIVFCILPVCVLIFWRTPAVIEAFEAPKPSFGG